MRKIQWGVMSTAYIFERDTAEGMRQAENCQLYAIAGRSLEKALLFQEKYGFEKAYGSYQDLLDDPRVEAVYIPLPNTLHYEWTIKALKAKKHVLCEKPLAPTAAQAAEMFACARENGVLLMEAFAYQHSPYIAAVEQAVKSGQIGDVRYMESALITSDYVPENIRMRRDTLGGCTYDLGVYCASLTQRILGAPSTVKAVSTFSPEGIDLYTAVLMEYENGATGVFITTTGDAFGTNRLEIQLDGAKIVAEDDKLDVWEFEVSEPEFNRTNTAPFGHIKAHKLELETDGENPQHAGVINAWGAAILRGEPMVADGREGIRGLTLSNAMHLSSWLDQTIEMPLDDNLFYEELMKRVATSRRKENVKAVIADTRDTYAGAK